MAITLEQAKALKAGDKLHQPDVRGADRYPRRWVVTSVKTWKRSPERVAVHLKHGLYTYYVLTETDLERVSLGDGRE